ncbi:MAG: type II toxin-antitoxin system CcdA family antitoxin [Candidatus Hermodarchaeia archaeon]
MGNKKKVLLYINEDIVTEAKEIGLNLSKTCENALKTAIQRLKHSDNENLASSNSSSVKDVCVGVRRFELPTFGYHRSRTSSFHPGGQPTRSIPSRALEPDIILIKMKR